MAPSAAAPAALGLPVSVIGPVDLGRLIRELETLDNELMQQELRKDSEIKLPKTSRLLDQTVELNKFDLLKETERKQLKQQLTKLHDQAPTLHISFSADPSPLFLQKLMGWLRQEISPQLLLTVGEQPSIGAGCVVRTTNKYFDFSLREHFMKQRSLLMESLQGVTGTKPEAVAEPVAAPAVTKIPVTADMPSHAPAPASTVHQRVQS